MKKHFFYIPAIFCGTVSIVVSVAVRSFVYQWYFLVLLLALGAFLFKKGKVLGTIPGILVGICVMMWGIEEIPRRMNMGNAGAEIEPTRENAGWYIWNSEIPFGIVLIIFYLACGIYVLAKNGKAK